MNFPIFKQAHHLFCLISMRFFVTFYAFHCYACALPVDLVTLQCCTKSNALVNKVVRSVSTEIMNELRKFQYWPQKPFG